MVIPKDAPGFTLIELLMTISIIAILSALAFPMVRNMQSRSYEVTCTSNLRQLGAALLQHASDHSGDFPKTQGSYWGAQPTLISALETYLDGNRNVWFCKSQLQATKNNATALYQAGFIGYYYWAWRGNFWDSEAMKTVTPREESPWVIQGWNSDLPETVLLSDGFGYKESWGGPEDVQYHAGGSQYLSLRKPGSNILVSSGAVMKAAPLR